MTHQLQQVCHFESGKNDPWLDISNLSHFGINQEIMSDVTMDYSGDASQADEAAQSPETCVPKSPCSPSSQIKIKSEDSSDFETKPKAPEGGRLQFYFGK